MPTHIYEYTDVSIEETDLLACSSETLDHMPSHYIPCMTARLELFSGINFQMQADFGAVRYETIYYRTDKVSIQYFDM